jgi:hypothetical protein
MDFIEEIFWEDEKISRGNEKIAMSLYPIRSKKLLK